MGNLSEDKIGTFIFDDPYDNHITLDIYRINETIVNHETIAIMERDNLKHICIGRTVGQALSKLDKIYFDA